MQYSTRQKIRKWFNYNCTCSVGLTWTRKSFPLVTGCAWENCYENSFNGTVKIELRKNASVWLYAIFLFDRRNEKKLCTPSILVTGRTCQNTYSMKYQFIIARVPCFDQWFANPGKPLIFVVKMKNIKSIDCSINNKLPMSYVRRTEFVNTSK